jgi:hypothetical protein
MVITAAALDKQYKKKIELKTEEFFCEKDVQPKIRLMVVGNIIHILALNEN